MTNDTDHSRETAALQGGERMPSITPEGEAVNRSITEAERATAVPITASEEGHLQASGTSESGPSQVRGYGMESPASQPDNRPHEGGDPLLDGDAQYGASPIRTARYDENHESNAEIAEGKTRSGHHGAQARYPSAKDAVIGPTGHDEQQQSRDLAKNGR
jgi:hypothetical protein